MRAEQAIYTSARTKTRGYQLTSQSPGVEEEHARSLIQWCPSHAGLASSQSDASSLNFHPVIDGTVALSRTVYGGAEYSSRGGLQVVTRILLLREEALAGYEYDPTTLAQVATALGHLRLDPSAPEQLQPVDLPDRPFRQNLPYSDGTTIALASQLLDLLDSRKRVAVIGTPAVIKVLAELFARVPERQRLKVSFATGLKPSMHRAFRLQFLPSVDLSVQHQLIGQGITVLDCSATEEQHVTARRN